MTTGFLDSSSAAVAKGDAVVLIADAAGMQVVTRLTPASAAAAGRVWGLAERAVTPGKSGPFKQTGIAAATLTGLSPAAGFVRANTTTGRAERVDTYSQGDLPLGKADLRGNLNMALEAGAGIVPGVGGLASSETVRVSGAGTLTAEVEPEFFGFAIRCTGADQRDQLQAAIDAANAAWLTDGVQRVVQLGRGVMRVGAAPRLKSGVKVRGPETTIKPTAGWSPGAGLVDDRRNFLFYGEGTPNPAVLNTVLTTAITPGGVPYYGAGARKMSTSSLGSLAVGDYITIEGHESGDGSSYGGAGSLVVCCEPMRVAALQTGPNRITFTRPTKQHHVTDNHGVGTPLSVRKLDELRDAEVEGVTFDADGKLLAVGVLVDRLLNVRLTNCKFRGFTRFAVDSFGSEGLVLDECLLLGSNSGGFNLESAIDPVIREPACMAHEARFHPASTAIRNAIRLAGWTIGARILGGLIQHMCSGVKFECFRNASMVGTHIDDIDITAKMALDSEEHVGVGIDMGVIDLSYANFAGPLTIAGCTVTNCRQDPNVTDADHNGGVYQCYSVWLHDVYGLDIQGLTVENTGLSPYTTIDGDAKYYMTGVGSQDCAGQADGVKVKGCEVAFGYHSSQGLVLSDYEFRAVPGSGSNPAVAMFFNSNTLSTLLMRDGRVQGGVYFGPNFAMGPQNLIEAKGIDFDGSYFAGDMVMCGNTGSGGGTRRVGDVVCFNPTTSLAGVRWADLPAGAAPHGRVGIVAMGPANTISANGYMFVALTGARAEIQVSGLVQAGDLLETVTGQDWAVANNATARPIGAAVTNNVSGVGPIQMGPPQ